MMDILSGAAPLMGDVRQSGSGPGFDPTRFQTELPACYRASWQLPGPDSHRQATTSFRSGHNRWTITS
jgi:hypothetical protein